MHNINYNIKVFLAQGQPNILTQYKSGTDWHGAVRSQYRLYKILLNTNEQISEPCTLAFKSIKPHNAYFGII